MMFEEGVNRFLRAILQFSDVSGLVAFVKEHRIPACVLGPNNVLGIFIAHVHFPPRAKILAGARWGFAISHGDNLCQHQLCGVEDQPVWLFDADIVRHAMKVNVIGLSRDYARIYINSVSQGAHAESERRQDTRHSIIRVCDHSNDDLIEASVIFSLL